MRDQTDQANLDNSEPSKYPYGRLKDSRTDGTPVRESLLGDMFVNMMRWLDIAGLSANHKTDNQTDGYELDNAMLNRFSTGVREDLVLLNGWANVSIITSVNTKVNFNTVRSIEGRLLSTSATSDEVCTVPFAPRTGTIYFDAFQKGPSSVTRHIARIESGKLYIDRTNLFSNYAIYFNQTYLYQ